VFSIILQRKISSFISYEFNQKLLNQEKLNETGIMAFHKPGYFVEKIMKKMSKYL